MKSFKIAGCVIVYKPQNSVEHNILSYTNYLSKIYLIDNSEGNAFYSYSKFDFKTTLIHSGKNEGIAKRLNQACELAINNGFEFLLTMDQDSYFDESALKNYFECIEDYHLTETVSMFGINYKNNLHANNCIYNKTKFLITSGSVINLINYKKIGAFDEDLFIDFVDTEYCFRSIEKGYDIIELPNIFMHHKLGEANEKRSLKNLKKTNRSFHSSLRLYYMTRNFLYLNSKYKQQFTLELADHKKDILIRIKNKILYNSNRLQTLKFLVKAWKDFTRNKMGKQA